MALIKEKEERIYFYGLDELRAIAALLVYFHHVELFKFRDGLPSLIGTPFFHTFTEKIGKNAVVAFFVLSGFLITYLLLVEKEKTGTINVKAFYIRRILRIWPLYFLIVFIGFVVMPLLNSTGWFSDQVFYPKVIEQLDYNSLPLYVLFLSNFAIKYFKPVAGAAQSWSVSVEEQFYLIWPHIIKYSKGIKRTLIIVIILLILKIGAREFILNYYGKTTLFRIINLISIQYMFVGAIFAILLFWDKTKVRLQQIMSKKWVLIVTLLAIGAELVKFNHSNLLAFLFGILILAVITQKIEIKALKYFGKISYGIYMLHPLMLFISMSIALHFKGTVAFNMVFYSLSFVLTILIAGLSFKYFEEPILRRKQKHTIIESGSK
jgi:peptidoglycan/LPS O-acetylase OafA/YrhL